MTQTKRTCTPYATITKRARRKSASPVGGAALAADGSVETVAAGGAAEEAGLAVGARITAVAGARHAP